MNVKLISVTQPIEGALEGIEYPEQLIAFCARVSNPSNQLNTGTADRLIQYLVEKKHWSPFEMVNACVEVTTTRDIARQILRHRSFTFQEFSQRYADPTKELDFVLREARLQDSKNRQNSIDVNDEQLQATWRQKQEEVIAQAKHAYQWAVENGIAKEVARAVLPEGNTVSRMYINGTVRSWIHYLEMRTGKETQKEHREIARAIAEAVSEIFPLINNFSHKDN